MVLDGTFKLWETFWNATVPENLSIYKTVSVETPTQHSICDS